MTPLPTDLYWDTAKSVCTAKQLRVLELREAYGFSLRTIALAVDASPSTVRDHIFAAHRRIDHALRETAPG
jgi:DNA-directed RNA polymerase specialized sigma24 family protein